MLEWTTVDTARIADGREFELSRHDDNWVVRVDTRILMSNRMHDSELALASQAIARVQTPRTVLVGGLGLGYTLRAALDCLSEDAEVSVVELLPELVVWNRQHLGPLNAHPLDDSRCRIVVGDVLDVMLRSPQTFDVILLDVDNGPRAFAQAKNQRLYNDKGIRACRAALRPGGILALWSTGPNARYERRLQGQGFDVEVLRVAARVGSRATHVLFLAKRGSVTTPDAA